MKLTALQASWALRSFRTAVILCGLMGLASNASASVVKVTYDGTITGIAFFRGASETYGLRHGQSVSGSFTVDTSVADDNASPLIAFMPRAVSSMSFAAFSADPAYISYSYLYLDALPSQDAVGAYANAVMGNVSDVYQFSLAGPGATSVLGSDLFSLLDLRLGAFDPFSVSFSFQRAVFIDPALPQVTQFFARIDSLRVFEVEEPPAVLLGASALALLALVSTSGPRRRRSTALVHAAA